MTFDVRLTTYALAAKLRPIELPVSFHSGRGTSDRRAAGTAGFWTSLRAYGRGGRVDHGNAGRRLCVPYASQCRSRIGG